MASSSTTSSRRGLPDYSRDKARVRRNDSFAKKVLLGSSECSALDYIEDCASVDGPMTIQEFRESLSRDNEDDEEVTFMLRLGRKRRRDGSTHSVSKGRHNLTREEEKSVSAMNEARNPPTRSPSGKSQTSIRASGSDQLGASAEEISAYGYGPGSPRRVGKRSSLTRDQILQGGHAQNQQTYPMKGLLEGSDSEQTGTSFSERSMIYSYPQQTNGTVVAQDQRTDLTQIRPKHPTEEPSESEQTETSASETSNSLSLASYSSTPGGLSRSYDSTASPVGVQKTMKSVKLKASCQTTDDDGSDDDKKPKPPTRERPIFAGFGMRAGSYTIGSPSDSDDSFTSFAQKYSRYSQPSDSDPKEQRSADADSTMDLNESFSSFASFAEDEDWAHESISKPGRRGLLDGSEDSSENAEEELSLGEQSPDSVIVDLTSVSTSANSQSLSLSPRSSSKASLSRERKSVFEVPLNDVKTTKSQKEDKRGSRSRREQGDSCSVGSTRSRVSNRSGGSWLSRRSVAQSTNSRFSRLEEYLNRDSTSEKSLNACKDGGSKFSCDRKDDISTTSSLTMGTFQTRETKDSEWKKLSEVVESEETPNPAALEGVNATLKRIHSNPFLAADRTRNTPVKDTFESPRRTTKAWRPANPEQVKTPLKSPALENSYPKIETSPPPNSPTKNSSTTPRKLSLDRLSLFTTGKDSVSARTSPKSPHNGADPSKSDVSRLPRWSPSKTPTRDSTIENLLNGLGEIARTSISPLVKVSRETFSPMQKQNDTLSLEPDVVNSATSPSPWPTEMISTDSNAKPVNDSKVGTNTKKFEKPSLLVNKGINLFNPSATSTEPRNQMKPRFVGDSVTTRSTRDRPSTTKKSSTRDATKPSTPSKVQSYLRRHKKKNADSLGNNIEKFSLTTNPQKKEEIHCPDDRKNVQNGPVRKEGNWCNPVEDGIKSPIRSKETVSKSNKIKEQMTVSTSILSSRSPATRSGFSETTKPSVLDPKASRPRIDHFLEKHGQNTIEGDVFKEPFPSPWRPSAQSARSRQRLTDSNSRVGSIASSIASSKCSTASHRTSAVSMFQPHRQVAVESLPGHHSPAQGSSIAEEEKETKLSLVEQRKRMFQESKPGLSSTQHNTRYFQGMSRQSYDTVIHGTEKNKNSLRLPTAHEISSRLSNWHVDGLTNDA